MAEDDEIDILGDFTFDNCLTKTDTNFLASSSCSDLLQCDYTVHPQWLLDTAAMNWYDNIPTDDVSKKSRNDSIDLKGDKSQKCNEWTPKERELLHRGIEIYGRDSKCLSQFISSKSEIEIQLLIEQEFGINLDENVISSGIATNISERSGTALDYDVLPSDFPIDEGIPDPVQEVVCMDNDSSQIIQKIVHQSKNNRSSLKTNFKTDLMRNHRIQNKVGKNKKLTSCKEIYNTESSSKSLGEVLCNNNSFQHVCVEPVGENCVTYCDDIPKNKVFKHTVGTKKMSKLKEIHDKYSRRKCKFTVPIKKTIGQNNLPSKNIKNVISSSSIPTQDNDQSKTLMQIVTGSGQTLSLSKGEQVIKIGKNNDPDSSSDVEVDVESDDATALSPKKCLTTFDTKSTPVMVKQNQVEFVFKPIADEKDMQPLTVEVKNINSLPFTKRKRKKKLILDGGGGYTITHSDLGDIYQMGVEPKIQYAPKKPPIGLVYCKSYTKEHPAPYHVVLSTAALLLMDIHAHMSHAEVMGLLGGKYSPELSTLFVKHYVPCDSLEISGTHCDMCPVSQSLAYEDLLSKGCEIVGWFHSHPRFPPHPSAQDIISQIDMQTAFSKGEPITATVPFVGIIISPLWLPGRTASQYRCLCVERIRTEEGNQDMAYKFSVNLNKDLNKDNIKIFLENVSKLNAKVKNTPEKFSINMNKDICPDAKITCLNKCISSVHHHLQTSGCTDDDGIQKLVLSGLKDIFL